jgi:hypothetical protein
VGVVETGGSGRRSEDEGDTITHSEQRTRGPRGSLPEPAAGGVDNTHREASRFQDDEGSLKPMVQWGYADLVLKPSGLSGRGELIVRRLSLKPYWGKPAVRNFREDAGNVSDGRTRNPLCNRKSEDRKLPT